MECFLSELLKSENLFESLVTLYYVNRRKRVKYYLGLLNRSESPDDFPSRCVEHVLTLYMCAVMSRSILLFAQGSSL